VPEANLDLIIKMRTSNQISDTKVALLDDLVHKTFSADELLKKVNEWAVAKNFKVVYREGIKQLQVGWKREMRCSVKECSFKLTFKSIKLEERFELDQVVSFQHNEHSSMFILICQEYF